MNRLLFFLITVSFAVVMLSSCRKNSDDSFFIEATINGVKWKGLSTGDYLAVNADNSRMKIFITATNPAVTSFNFFSNSSLTPFYYYCSEYDLENGFIAPFNSKLMFKWETTAEHNTDKFYIEQSLGPPADFQIIGSVQGSGTSTTPKQYSVALPDVQIPYLSSVRYRMLIITLGGTTSYSGAIPANIVPGKAQIAYSNSANKVFFPLDNDQNQMSITSYDPATSERRGTFSFNYKDEAGNIVEVRNGKFHLKL